VNSGTITRTIAIFIVIFILFACKNHKYSHWLLF
jgi:hypothetical protein